MSDKYKSRITMVINKDQYKRLMSGDVINLNDPENRLITTIVDICISQDVFDDLEKNSIK